MKGKRLKAEIAIIGDGCAALFTATRLMDQGHDVVLINPKPHWNVDDIRCPDGLSLWRAAYRASSLTVSMSQIWDELRARLKEALPVSLEEAGVERGEHWSILSSTPIHQQGTIGFEQEYFRLERKPWTVGQVRLVNPDYLEARFKALGLRLSNVASIEGAMVRHYGLWWDAPRIGKCLAEFIFRKDQTGSCRVMNAAEIRGRVGRRLLLSYRGEELSLEYESKLLVMLSGGIVPDMTPLVKGIPASWIQGLRKRRREQHFAWFAKRSAKEQESLARPGDPLWFELGPVSYRWSSQRGEASWSTRSGPDGLETIIDEALRAESAVSRQEKGWTVFARNKRYFRMEWEWKNPQWRETPYATHWASAFEGDLWSLMELLWNLPTQ